MPEVVWPNPAPPCPATWDFWVGSKGQIDGDWLKKAWKSMYPSVPYPENIYLSL